MSLSTKRLLAILRGIAEHFENVSFFIDRSKNRRVVVELVKHLRVRTTTLIDPQGLNPEYSFIVPLNQPCCTFQY